MNRYRSAEVVAGSGPIVIDKALFLDVSIMDVQAICISSAVVRLDGEPC